MKNICYALQACDTKSYQNLDRFASNNRTEISKKCIYSFFKSVNLCASIKPEINHYITIVKDNCSKSLSEFLSKCSSNFSSKNIFVYIVELKQGGIVNSFEECYNILLNSNKDYVYLVQDDYLFIETCIVDIIEIYEQIYNETKTESVVSPFNDVYHWLTIYRNVPTPRAIFVGKKNYWIQIYDVSCSYFTSLKQFKLHQDLYKIFLNLTKNKSYRLESDSFNKMFTQRKVLGITSINSLALHLQSEFEKDPYVDYKPIWDNININL